MSITQAVVFVPHVADLARYATTCLDYCTSRGYEVAGVVHGDWRAAFAMLDATADVLVVARAEHIRTETPRIEIVAQDSPPAASGGRRHRVARSRIIRPDAEG